METTAFPKVDPTDLCPNYVQGDSSLPEEMPTCDLCRFYSQDDTCHYPEKMQ